MRLLQKLVTVSATGVLLFGIGILSAQDPPPATPQQQQQAAPPQTPSQGDANRDAAAGKSTLTGCLSKDSSGNYVLDDNGVKTTVSGGADLEKHSANHKVKLTGAMKTDTAGKSIFEVSKIDHISDTCAAK